MATSTASGHHVVDLFDATACPAEVLACSFAIMVGNGKLIFPAPGGSGEQKAEQQKQSDGAVAHNSSPNKTSQVKNKMCGGGNNVAGNAEQNRFCINASCSCPAALDFYGRCGQLWVFSFSRRTRDFLAGSKVGSRLQASTI